MPTAMSNRFAERSSSQAGSFASLRPEAIAVVLLLFIALSTATAQSSGLLLGMRNNECVEGDCHTRYRTLWIAQQAGVFQLVAELPDLIVPRQTGFFRVGIRKYCEVPGGWDLSAHDTYFEVPIHERPLIKGGLISCTTADSLAEKNYVALKKKKTEDADSESESEIHDADVRGVGHECEFSGTVIEFLNPNYISTSHGYSVECGVHPSVLSSVGVATLGSPSRSVAFSSLAKDAGDVYRLRAKRALIDHANDPERGGKAGKRHYRID